MTDYKAVIVGTELIDEDSRIVKIYFLENTEKNNPWKEGELDGMRKGFASHPLLNKGVVTVVSFSDKRTGFSRIFYHNQKKQYINNGPLTIRNSDLKIEEGYDMKNSIIVGNDDRVVPGMTCWAEQKIVDFGQTLLCEEGLEAFKEEWSPHNILEFKKPEPLI